MDTAALKGQLDGVLVCLGCSNRTPQAGRLVKHRCSFLEDPEASSPGSRPQLMRCLLKAPFLGHSLHFLAVSSHGEKGQGALWDLFPQGTDPFHEGSTLVTSSLPKAPPSNTITEGVRISRWILRGHRHSDHSRCCPHTAHNLKLSLKVTGAKAKHRQ